VHRRPGLLVLAAAVLWGTTGTAQALAPDGATPLGVGAVRLGLGGAGLVAVAAARARAGVGLPWGGGRGSRGGGRAWWWRAAVGAVCVAAYQPAFFGAVDRTGVAAGTIVAIGSAPLLAGLLGWVVRRERPPPAWWPATGLALAGGVLLVAGGSGDLRLDGAGVLLALAAGASYAGYTVAAKDLLASGDPVVVMAILFGGGAVLLVPVLAVEPLGWVLEPSGAAAALHLGLLTVTAAYLLFAVGLRGVAVATAGTLTLAEPATAGLLGLTVLGERLTPAGWVGVALVLGGLVLLVWPGGPRWVSRRSRPARAPRRARR
jgi:drug/metabolite transporter, DME family